MTADQQRILQLRSELNHHNHAYYVLNAPEISDREFDMLLKELERLEAENPDMADPLSPTQRVGSDLSGAFEQTEHIFPMLSLGNTYSIADVDDWFDRVRSGLGGEEFTVVGEMKFDGTSISLIYEHGRLVRAVTRGDGERGDIVTENVKTILSIPLQLQGEGWPDFFEIRGEILMPWSAFERLNREREFNEEPLFANPRNAASGTLKTQNSREVARRGLDAYFYYLLGPELPFDNHFDNMMAARSWGFKVSDIMTRLHSLKEVDDFITHWDEARRSLPVATDGLVFKVDSLRQQLNLGYTAKSPRWAMAYKFAAERALTRLRFVSFEVGRMGIVTPVANLEPVLLSGTIVKRASLHNEDIIKGLGIHEGDMLYVEKGGEIIPKITGVDASQRQPGARPIEFVSHCPACGAPLVRIEGEAAWQCPDKFNCPPQIAGRVEHFVGRKMMNIEGIGDRPAALRRRAGAQYRRPLRPSALAAGTSRRVRPSLGRACGGKHPCHHVRALRPRDLCALDSIRGRYRGQKGGAGVPRHRHAHGELAVTKDIGPRIAESIVDYFGNPINRSIVERLRAAGLQMRQSEGANEGRTDLLQGKSFVISGVFALHSRDEYKAMIELNGGKNVGSISKKTDYVLAGDNMGPAKREKASSLGIPIIDEQQFLAMLKPADFGSAEADGQTNG